MNTVVTGSTRADPVSGSRDLQGAAHFPSLFLWTESAEASVQSGGRRQKKTRTLKHRVHDKTDRPRPLRLLFFKKANCVWLNVYQWSKLFHVRMGKATAFSECCLRLSSSLLVEEGNAQNIYRSSRANWAASYSRGPSAQQGSCLFLVEESDVSNGLKGVWGGNESYSVFICGCVCGLLSLPLATPCLPTPNSS